MRYNRLTYQFIDPLPEDLTCQKCHQLAYEPQQMKCCSNLYCEPCLPSHLSGWCPSCRKDGESFPDGRSKSRIGKLCVKCPNSLSQCPWEGRLDDVTEHRSQCEKETVPCTYRDIGCEEEMLRDKLKEHEEEMRQTHLDSSMKKIMELQETVRRQNKAIEEMDKRCQLLLQAVTLAPPITVKMNHYPTTVPFGSVLSSDAWISSNFFKGRYKLCLILKQKGKLPDYETEVALIGEQWSDNGELTWPCNGRARVKFLLPELKPPSFELTFQFHLNRPMNECILYNRLLVSKFVHIEDTKVSWAKTPIFVPHLFSTFQSQSKSIQAKIEYVHMES